MPANDHNKELHYERICIFYSASNIGYLGMAICVLFLGLFTSLFSSPGLALTWVFAVYIAYIPRIVLSIQFNRKLRKQEITPENIQPWEDYHFYNSILPFSTFAAIAFIPYEKNEFTGLLFSAFIVITMIANANLLYSTSKKSIFLFINITFIALFIRCLMIQTLHAFLLAAFLVTAYFFLYGLINRQNRILVENIALKIENKNQSLIDPLTKIWNRRYLNLYMDKLINISKRNNEPFSVIILDLDHFKNYNDTKGHNAGDALLIKLANVLIECSRDQDLVIRYGGEEFLIVLPKTNIKQAELTADRILGRVRQSTDVTISAGLATYTHQMNFDQLIHAADTALYKAKNSGRNRYVVATAA